MSKSINNPYEAEGCGVDQQPNVGMQFDRHSGDFVKAMKTPRPRPNPPMTIDEMAYAEAMTDAIFGQTFGQK